MQNILKTTLFLAFLATVTVASGRGKNMMVAGSGWNKIAILDRESKTIKKTFDLPENSECNSLTMGYGKSIVFTYREGVRAIDMDGKTLFDIKIDGKEEMQSVDRIKGGYLVGVCGTPSSRILELDRKGNITKEIKCNLEVDHPHAQHRIITKTAEGHYLVPIMAKNVIVEFDNDGKELRRIDVGAGVFCVKILKSGNWLVACGDGGSFIELNPITEQVVSRVDAKTIGDGIKLGFIADIDRLKNGNTLVCNWLGHTKYKHEPILLELDKENKIVWKIEAGSKDIGAISSVYLY